MKTRHWGPVFAFVTALALVIGSLQRLEYGRRTSPDAFVLADADAAAAEADADFLPRRPHRGSVGGNV